jgi:hypothetical protein
MTLGFRCSNAFVNPFATGSAHPFVAGRTPGIRPLVIGIIGRPEESNSLPIEQTISDVLADKGLRLYAMYAASEVCHSVPSCFV